MGKWRIVKQHTGYGDTIKQYRGLSTWEKPTEGVQTGDELLEMDTGNIYMFDSETPKWWPL